MDEVAPNRAEPRRMLNEKQVLLIVPVGMIIQAGFPTPNGVGGGEWAYGGLYALLGSTVACGLLGSLVQRFVIWVVSFAGFLVYLRMRPTLNAAAENAAAELAPAQT